MTETEDAPQEWTEKTIEEITNLQRDNIPSDEQGGLPHVGLEHLEQFSPRISSESSENVSSNKYKFERGDILFGQIRSYLEKVCIADRDGVCSTDIFVIEPDEVNRWYLWSLLLSDDVNRWSQRASTGTKMPRVQWDAFSNKHVSVPPVGEQERIASVLYTVDQNVEALDQRHSDLQDLKHALMQDLLFGRRRLVEGDQTESAASISGNGSELTCDEIPSDWDLEMLGDVCKVNASIDAESDEVEYLPMDALNEELPWPDYTQKRNPNEHSGTLFKEQDTLVAKITPCAENGKSALITDLDSEFGIATTEVITLTPTDINPKYLYYYAISHPSKNYTVSRMRGTSGRQRVPKSVFEQELKIPVPSGDEQERIASVLYTVDEMIARTSELRDEYEQAKRGLMQDLLSGKVRTPNSLQPTHHVHATTQL